jgi:tRNA C32,U32 (ribose-2'-O)-methylase TrmJ
VHSDELYKAASKAATSLRAAKTAPKLEPMLRKLTFLAGTISVDLKRLGHASKTEQARLAHELERAARTLE